MNPALRFALLVFGVMLPCLGLSARDVPVVAGTLLQCTLNEPDLSSQTAQAGDPIVCYARPLEQFGCPAFPRGTLLTGRFMDYKDPGRLIGKGWMEVEFDRIVLPDGEAPIAARVVGVHGYRVNRQGHILGKGHAKRDAAEWAVPVLWPAKLVTLPLRGPRPELKGEKLITLRLLEDVSVPCRGGVDPYRPGWHYFGDSGSNESQLQPFSAHTVWRPFGPAETPPDSPHAAASGDALTAFRDGHHSVLIENSWPDKVASRQSPSSAPN